MDTDEVVTRHNNAAASTFVSGFASFMSRFKSLKRFFERCGFGCGSSLDLTSSFEGGGDGLEELKRTASLCGPTKGLM
jgi:hypothetical protein